MNNRYIIAVLMFIYTVASAQQGALTFMDLNNGGSTLAEEVKYTEPTVLYPSPQSMLIQKFVSHPTIDCYGLTEVTIPLHEIEIDGLKIPITLNYHGGGVKFLQEDGEVGVGWLLSAGAYRVSRILYGRDDELVERYSEDELEHALNHEDSGHRESFFSRLHSESPEHFTYTNNSGRIIDGEYDIFSYTLPSTNGTFVMSDNRRKQIINSNNLNKIELKNTVSPPQSNIPWLNDIDIIDSNGFLYSMGGGDNHKEYTSGQAKWTSAWVLNTIKSPLNKNINFIYEKRITQSKESCFDSQINVKEANAVIIPSTHFVRKYNGSVSRSTDTHNFKCTSSSLTLFVSQIQTDYETITFKRNDLHLLEEIIIESRISSFKKSIYLEYYMANRTGSEWHTQLKKVSIAYPDHEQQTYHLEYFPSFAESESKAGCDMWGYYSRRPYTSRSEIQPSLFEEIGRFSFIQESSQLQRHNIDEIKNAKSGFLPFFFDRELDTHAIHSFSLKKMVLPTGGIVEYEYEPHILMKTSRPGGGQRIRRIRTEDIDNRYITEYSYRTYGQDNQGNIGYTIDPRFFVSRRMQIFYDAGWTDIGAPDEELSVIPLITFTTFPVIPELGSQKVKYSDVIIKRYDPKFQLTDRLVRSYNFSPYSFTYNQSYISTGVERYDNIKAPYWMVTSRDFGNEPTLRQELYYSSEGRLLKSHKYLYGHNTSKVNQGVAVTQVVLPQYVNQNGLNAYLKRNNPKIVSNYSFIHTNFNYAMTSMTLYSPPFLLSEEILSHESNGDIKENIEYHYDGSLLSKKIKTIGQNIKLETHLKYPQHSDADVYENMVGRNMIAKPIEKIVINNGKTIYWEKTNYGIFNSGSILPASIERAFSSDPDEFQTLTTYDSYDSRGNIQQITGENKIPTTYLWGYKGYYPVIQIKNSDIVTVDKALQLSLNLTKEDLSNKVAINPEVLRKLYNQSLLRDAYISTFTYNHMEGIVSTTDPSEKQIQYEYKFGRLSKEIMNGEAIKLYDYNLMNKENKNIHGEIIISGGTIKGQSLTQVVLDFETPETGYLYKWEIKDSSGKIHSSSTAKKYLPQLSTLVDKYLVVLQVTDPSLNRSKFYKVDLNIDYPDLNGYINPYPKELATNSISSIECIMNSGSGKFQYTWEIIDAENKLEFSSTSLDKTLKYSFNNTGFYTIRCKVLDMLSNKSKEFVNTYLVKNILLKFDPEPYRYVINEVKAVMVQALAGQTEKSKLKYDWKIVNKNGEVISATTNSARNIFEINIKEEGLYTLSCRVFDLYHDKEELIESRIYVGKPLQYLNFSEINTPFDDLFAHGYARLILPEDVDVTFSIHHFIKGSNKADISIRIGSHVIDVKNQGNKQYTLPLKKGINFIDITITDGYASYSDEVHCSMVMANKDYLKIGEHNNLIVKFNHK